MTSALAYSPRRSPLGRAAAGAAAIHLISFATVAFVTANPLLLAGCGAAVVLAGLAAGAGRTVAVAARWAVTLGVVIVAVNVIAAQRGDTLLLRGPDVPILGTVDVSAEALAEGGVLALRIAIVFCAFALHTACVDPDRLMRLMRPVARRSALTATLIARLVPLAAADGVRVREATALRGPAAAPVGRAALVRRLVAGSLDRAVDVAATLELRGYSAGAPGRAARPPRAPGDLAFALSGLIALATVIAAQAAGVSRYESYPVVAMDAGVGTLAVAASLPVAALWPVALDALRAARTPEPRHA